MQVMQKKFFEPYDYESYRTCEFCLMEKMTKSPFSRYKKRAKEFLALVHSDVCGPMITLARGGYSYFIIFTDNLSRYGYMYLMKYKSEVFDKFKKYQKMVEKQTEKKNKVLQSDRGGKYLSSKFLDHLKR